MQEYIENFNKVQPELIPQDYLNTQFFIPAGTMTVIGLEKARKNARVVCYNETLKKLQTMSQFAVNFQVRRVRKEIRKGL